LPQYFQKKLLKIFLTNAPFIILTESSRNVSVKGKKSGKIRDANPTTVKGL